MKMKKMISNNKLCVCMVMGIMGAAAGMMMAKLVISKCSCCEQLKCKAKKAFKAMESNLL